MEKELTLRQVDCILQAFCLCSVGVIASAFLTLKVACATTCFSVDAVVCQVLQGDDRAVSMDIG